MERRMAENSIINTFRRVVGIRKEAKSGVTQIAETTEGEISKSLFDYLFKTQADVEAEGPMDYHRYSKILWQDLVLGEEAGDQEDSSFKNFEGNLILGLHNIKMKEHGYPGLIDNLGELAARYGEKFASVSIWSQGDEQATGYQNAKIARSGIMGAFIKVSPKEFIEKAGYLVSGNKFDQLDDFLHNHPDKLKIVVIEDSRKNLQKVADLVDSQNLVRGVGGQIKFVPIWAAYSREGSEASTKALAEGTTDELDRQKAELSALESPDELLNVDKFGPIFEDGHILVDFDGVIGDNLTMRQSQARVKYNALISSVRTLRGISAQEADKVIMDNLQKKRGGL